MAPASGDFGFTFWRQTMATFDTMTPLAPSASFSPADYVSRDTEALASHMDSCASGRGKFFAFYSALESAHSMICPRMVTAAAVGVLLLACLAGSV